MDSLILGLCVFSYWFCRVDLPDPNIAQKNTQFYDEAANGPACYQPSGTSQESKRNCGVKQTYLRSTATTSKDWGSTNAPVMYVEH